MKYFLTKLLSLFSLTCILFSQNSSSENSDSLFININSSLSQITYADDICKSSIYIMNENIEKSQSKKISKVLAKNLKKNKKNLKIHKRYTKEIAQILSVFKTKLEILRLIMHLS